jgi:hypothetical protein
MSLRDLVVNGYRHAVILHAEGLDGHGSRGKEHPIGEGQSTLDRNHQRCDKKPKQRSSHSALLFLQKAWQESGIFDYGKK